MKWIKDNGDEIETNDLPATVEHCKAIGWTEKEAPKKKRGRPAKSPEIEE